jgi:uncharacterized protein (DUF488 family)
MITLTTTQLYYITAFVILIAIVLIAYLPNFIEWVDDFKLKIAMKKLYNQKVKELETFLQTKKHEWITMNIYGRKRFVCKHTGFCPEIEGFIPMYDVKYQLKMIEVEDKVQENINNKLTELMNKYNLKFFEMREIADEVLKVQNNTIKELLPE